MNLSNKDGSRSEEGRPPVKENTHQPKTYPTQSEKRVSQGLAGVRKVGGAAGLLPSRAGLGPVLDRLLHATWVARFLLLSAVPSAANILFPLPKPSIPASQNLLLLHRKFAVEAFLNLPFASKRRHLTQSLHRPLQFRPERRVGLHGGPWRGGTCDSIAARSSGYSVNGQNLTTR
jgi:hypothetical protein